MGHQRAVGLERCHTHASLRSMHAFMSRQFFTCTDTYTHNKHTQVHIDTHMHTHTRVHTHVHTHAHTHTCTLPHTSYANMYSLTCTFLPSHAHTQWPCTFLPSHAHTQWPLHLILVLGSSVPIGTPCNYSIT